MPTSITLGKYPPSIVLEEDKKDYESTADFILRMDRLFDVLNSSGDVVDTVIKSFLEMNEKFNSQGVLGLKNSKIHHWHNQNIFSVIKRGTNNLSCSTFRTSFRNALHLKADPMLNGNCEADDSDHLFWNSDTEWTCESETNEEPIASNITSLFAPFNPHDESDVDTQGLSGLSEYFSEFNPEDNLMEALEIRRSQALAYFAEYLLKWLWKNLPKCSDCVESLEDDSRLPENTFIRSREF